MDMWGVSSYSHVSTEYIQTSASQLSWPNIKQHNYMTSTDISSTFDVFSPYFKSQKRGSWDWVLIDPVSAHVTLMWGMDLSTRLHGVTFKMTDVHIHCCENLKYHLNDIWRRVRINEASHLSHTIPRKHSWFKAQRLSVRYTRFSANWHQRCTSTVFWLDIQDFSLLLPTPSLSLDLTIFVHKYH
jgi:hypothetical protein